MNIDTQFEAKQELRIYFGSYLCIGNFDSYVQLAIP